MDKDEIMRGDMTDVFVAMAVWLIEVGEWLWKKILRLADGCRLWLIVGGIAVLSIAIVLPHLFAGWLGDCWRKFQEDWRMENE